MIAAAIHIDIIIFRTHRREKASAAIPYGGLLILKKIETALIFGICLALIVGFACVGDQRELASKMIRLHVIANSDSEEDQALKLKVRDCVTDTVASMLEGEKNIDKAAEVISKNIHVIENRAEEVLSGYGCGYEVKAELGIEEYEKREYEGFTLPAGLYNSLRVKIGAAKGQNWWCVVFPPLCFTAASEFRETAEAAGLTDEEIKLITENDNKVVFKFRILEIIQKVWMLFK